jgi:type I restriction enzyme S subunit
MIASYPWKTVPFESGVTELTGGQPKVQRQEYLTIGSLPVIDQGQEPISGYTNDCEMAYKGPLPAVLFGDHTRIFKYVDFPFALGADGVKVLVPKKAFNPKFLFFYFQSVQIPSRGYSRHFKFLREVYLPCFPLSEQLRIVEILDQADTLRKKGAEAHAKVGGIRPALFYKMFGDPATNSKGWERTTLADGGALVRYGLGQPPKASPNGIPLIRATNIRWGTITDEDMMFVSRVDVPESRNAFLSADEVIVVRSGAYTGDVAQVTERWAGSVAGYDLIITPGENFCGEYIEAYLLIPHIQKNYFGNLKARAGQPHLNASQLSATPILRPPKNLQLRFAKDIEQIRCLLEQIIKSRQILDGVFTILLHHAFSGYLTANWREARMKELLAEMEEQANYLGAHRPNGQRKNAALQESLF